jgi:ribosomal protein L11 methyltransferase
MSWQRLNLIVAGPEAEALSDALEDHGAISTDLSDADAGTAAEREILIEATEAAAPWARCRLSALFKADAEVARILDAAIAESGASALAGASIDRVEDADWVALTQRQFEPIRAGERLWIVPTWHEAPRPGDVNVVLDPGAAFGTGSHPTTRMCLGWLEAHVRSGDAVLDYGCGSGILGIAALKLGAARATGVDVDPLALEAARYNSQRNGVALHVQGAQLELAGAFTITVANILANPLRMLAPVIASHTLPRGRIALAGILEDQAREVASAYAPWAALEVVTRDGPWVLMAGTRC